jgi:tRNA wybutosine-synthesizing protein 3
MLIISVGYRMSKDLFDAQKTTCLSAVDLSRKGSIDAPILDLVAFINNQSNYFTTSSCSGRIIVVDNVSFNNSKNKA